MTKSSREREAEFLRSLTDALVELGGVATTADVAEYQQRRLTVFDETVEKYREPGEDVIVDHNWKMVRFVKPQDNEDYV